MTFSRPAIERLIATVDSGLQYGELAPYAQGLRDCLIAIAAHDAIESASQRTIESGSEAFRVMREQWFKDRDELRAELARLIAELQGAESDLDHVSANWRLCEEENDRLESELARLTAERDALRKEAEAMRPVFDTALGSYGSQRGGHFGQPRPTDAMIELADAIDAYRASKERP